ncbi:hypothetical protein [Pedobacter endophyticus]|uniref:Uncharacterized protein n=1 Tax=Pedobacter endophyticus TaxID=2789740 RepID=A0A7S9PZA6_9SPHI|nr:hypothetical protein [Pedobacter endophyticus]QPH40308.1 hypothetical protein IZT61_03245 [Pedobacter endophyticus]
MKIETPLENYWHKALTLALAELKVPCRAIYDGPFAIILVHDCQLAIHLVNINNGFTPDDLTSLQLQYQNENIHLVHLWEDVWCSSAKQVLARLKSLLGLNLKIHGRQTEIRKIDKPTADQFLNNNHLQGAVSSRYKFGLYKNDELIAVATFSALRKMNFAEHYRSAELIRFAVKAGYSVSGGLSKLLKHFKNNYQPQDIMTYADKDWSTGKAYEKLGFVCKDSMVPQWFSLDQSLSRSINKGGRTAKPQVFNTGSIKFVLPL